MSRWGLPLLVLLAGCSDGPSSAPTTSDSGGTATAGGSGGGGSPGGTASSGQTAGGGATVEGGSGNTTSGGNAAGGTGGTPIGGGPPALCSMAAQPCSADLKCCAGATCVLLENLTLCADTCTSELECQSGCCAPLEAGGGACGPPELCASPCQPFVDCLSAQALTGSGVCGEAQAYLNAATDCELLAGCPGGACKSCIETSPGCTNGWKNALTACDNAAAAAGLYGSSFHAEMHAGATKYCGLP